MAVGIHIFADLYGINPEIISVKEKMMDIIEESVRAGNLTKISSDYHQFHPFGASGIVLLAESHISFHTWPEYGLITLDIFTCGEPEKADRAYEYLINVLKPEAVNYKKHERGDLIGIALSSPERT